MADTDQGSGHLIAEGIYHVEEVARMIEPGGVVAEDGLVQLV